jgi:hypothetical protein
MTPGLLAPAALALGAALAGAVILMYMLKLRREDRRVPSTLLWRAVIQDPPANAPWQRLRRSLLLLLQLLVLAALSFALARPFLRTTQVVGRNLVVLLDRSASMAATDVTPSRLEVAKSAVGDLARSAAGARVTVLAFDDGVEVLASGETDPAQVAAAVARVAPEPVRGDASDALAFTAALVEGQPDSQVVVFSDGNFDSAQAAPINAPVRFERVGDTADNQAISAVALRGGGAASAPELFVQASNHARQPVTRRVEVLLDGQLYDARDLPLPSGGQAAFTVAVPDGATTAEVRLTGQDALAVDDAGWAVRPRSERAKVALVSAGNRFLDTALRLLPGVESLTPVDPAATDEPLGRVDVSVLDGVLPNRLPPGGLLAIAPITDTAGVTVLGQLENPVPRVVAPEHPVLAGVDLSDVHILGAQALELGPDWTPLVVADVDGKAWPLVAAGRLADRPAVLLAFDVRASDLPLTPAFPVLVANSLAHLAPTALAGVPTGATLDEPLPLRFPVGVTGVQLTDPGGTTRALLLEQGQATLTDLRQPGLYHVSAETEEGSTTGDIAVNFTAAAESDVRPADSLALSAGPSGDGGGSPVLARRELWWLFALAALGLLVAEWLWYHRAALPRRRAAEQTTRP